MGAEIARRPRDTTHIVSRVVYLGDEWDAPAIASLGARFGLAVDGCVHLRTSQASVGVWRVESDQGPHVLHIHRAGMAAAELALSQRARILLAGAGLPAVAPRETPQGQTIVVAGGHPVEVQAWVDHDRQIDYGWEDLRHLVRVLAQAHDVLGADAELCGSLRARPTTELRLDELRANAPGVQARPGGGELGEQLVQAADVLETVCEAEGPCGGLEPTHGDVTSGNALIRADEVVALIDFGMLALRPRMADLAAAVFWSFFVGDLTQPDLLAWEEARACVRAYSNATSRSVGEAELTGLVLELARLPAAGIATAHREPDPVAEVTAFGRAMALAAWLVDDLDRAVDLVG